MTKLLQWIALGALRVDVYALVAAIRLAHACQRLTGVISFTLAKHSWAIAAALGVVECAGYWWRPFGGPTDSLPETIVDAFCVCVCLAACVVAHVAERQWDGTTMPSVCTPFVVDPLMRALMTVWIVSTLPLYVIAGAWPGLTGYATYSFQAAMYLMAVPPLPPAPKRALEPIHVAT